MISPVKLKIVKFTLKEKKEKKKKELSGAKTESMKDKAQPTIKENPDHILIHVGTNDFPIRRQPDIIAEDIIQLALILKIDSCDISVSNIVTRNDQYRNKASALTRKLKQFHRYKTFKWFKTPFKYKRYKDLIQ